MATPNAKSPPSNLQLVSDEEVAISLERLIDSVVMEVTAHRSALQPQQVNETNDEASNINALPNEIIFKVFSYLTQNQLGQIAMVCQRWNVLTKSPVLWRKVDVKFFLSDRRTSTVVKSFINRLPSSVTFTSLDFSELLIDLDFEELCLKLHQNCPGLEGLILTRCVISHILPKVINFTTQFLQGVKKLAFHYCNFSEDSRTVELSDNSNIEVLDLHCCDFSHFSKTQFSKLLNLKELRLSHTHVDDTCFVDDTSFLNQLHVLDLGVTYITGSTFLAIQRDGNNLKELYLCLSNVKARDLNFNRSVFPHLKKKYASVVLILHARMSFPSSNHVHLWRVSMFMKMWLNLLQRILLLFPIDASQE